MNPFDRALKEEERWLCNIANAAYPDDIATAKRVYIGPGTIPRYQQLEGAGWTYLPEQDE